jgi:hypothetical protein
MVAGDEIHLISRMDEGPKWSCQRIHHRVVERRNGHRNVPQSSPGRPAREHNARRSTIIRRSALRTSASTAGDAAVQIGLNADRAENVLPLA